MSDPSDDEQSDPSPQVATTASIESFAEVSEAAVEVNPTGGAKFWLKGIATPGDLARLAFAPALSLLGLLAGVALLLADKPFWEAAVVFAVAQGLSLLWWKMLKVRLPWQADPLPVLSQFASD